MNVREFAPFRDELFRVSALNPGASIRFSGVLDCGMVPSDWNGSFVECVVVRERTAPMRIPVPCHCPARATGASRETIDYIRARGRLRWCDESTCSAEGVKL